MSFWKRLFDSHYREMDKKVELAAKLMYNGDKEQVISNFWKYLINPYKYPVDVITPLIKGWVYFVKQIEESKRIPSCTMLSMYIKRCDPAGNNIYTILAPMIFRAKIQMTEGNNSSKINAMMESLGFVNTKYATGKDEIPGAMGEFGFDSRNPIPVNGIQEEEMYLERLVGDDKRDRRWNREGSVNVPTIYGCIDVYKSQFDEILYISPYHLHSSLKSPKGFSLKPDMSIFTGLTADELNYVLHGTK